MVPLSMSIILLAALILVSACFQEVTASTFDGLPRPKGFPDVPTAAYGKFPPAYMALNQPADCDWYGFANVNYPAEIGLQCLTYTFKTEVLDEANQGSLRPYEYIQCSPWSSSSKACYDSVWGNYYCVVGCFYMGNSSLPLPPVTALPPPAPPAAPGSASPGSASPWTSRGDALTPSSVVVVAVFFGGVLAAGVLLKRW